MSDINAEFLNQTVIIGAEKKNGKYEGKCVSNSVPLIKYKSAVKENGFLESGMCGLPESRKRLRLINRSSL